MNAWSEQAKRILETEFDEEFVIKMKQRMITSFPKYGPVAENYNPRARVADPAYMNAEKYLNKYLQTGNTEWLVDMANFAMIEYMFPSKQGAGFKETDEGSPGIGCSVNELKSSTPFYELSPRG